MAQSTAIPAALLLLPVSLCAPWLDLKTPGIPNGLQQPSAALKGIYEKVAFAVLSLTWMFAACAQNSASGTVDGKPISASVFTSRETAMNHLRVQGNSAPTESQIEDNMEKAKCANLKKAVEVAAWDRAVKDLQVTVTPEEVAAHVAELSANVSPEQLQQDKLKNPRAYADKRQRETLNLKLNAAIDQKLAAQDAQFAKALRDEQAAQATATVEKGVRHYSGLPLDEYHYLVRGRQAFWAAHNAKVQVRLSDPTLASKCGLGN